MNLLLSQSQDMLETAKAVGGLPTSAVLAIVCGALVWWVLRLDGKLDKANAESDAQRDARVDDLKQTIKDLGGSHKEAA